jgi:hypothetical protein
LKNLVITLTFILLGTTASNSQCFKYNTAFQTGERLTYNVMYNWGFIWIGAGDVVFSVKETNFHGRPVYSLDAHGTSYPSYDWFFKVRDSFQAYLDKETLQPLWHLRNTSEGNFNTYEEYHFDYGKNLIYSATQNTKKPYRRDTVKIEVCTFDLLSLAYFARNFDFTGLTAGQKIPVTMLLDNEIYHLTVRYVGKELLKMKGGEKYNTIKFSIQLVEGTVFKAGEELIVWVTDDKNHIPVLVDAKILVGSVKALLQSTENLRNKSTAKVK